MNIYYYIEEIPNILFFAYTLTDIVLAIDFDLVRITTAYTHSVFKYSCAAEEARFMRPSGSYKRIVHCNDIWHNHKSKSWYACGCGSRVRVHATSTVCVPVCVCVYILRDSLEMERLYTHVYYNAMRAYNLSRCRLTGSRSESEHILIMWAKCCYKDGVAKYTRRLRRLHRFYTSSTKNIVFFVAVMSSVLCCIWPDTWFKRFCTLIIALIFMEIRNPINRIDGSHRNFVLVHNIVA